MKLEDLKEMHTVLAYFLESNTIKVNDVYIPSLYRIVEKEIEKAAEQLMFAQPMFEGIEELKELNSKAFENLQPSESK